MVISLQKSLKVHDLQLITKDLLKVISVNFFGLMKNKKTSYSTLKPFIKDHADYLLTFAPDDK